MATWYVYIVQCADKSLYTGITNDPGGRIKKHNAGTGAKYTRSRRPVKLVRKERMKSATAARKREAVIKKLSRTQKLSLIRYGK